MTTSKINATSIAYPTPKVGDVMIGKADGPRKGLIILLTGTSTITGCTCLNEITIESGSYKIGHHFSINLEWFIPFYGTILLENNP